MTTLGEVELRLFGGEGYAEHNSVGLVKIANIFAMQGNFHVETALFQFISIYCAGMLHSCQLAGNNQSDESFNTCGLGKCYIVYG